MDDTLPLALTPEQLAAFTTAGSVVHAEDPATKRRYVLIDEAPETTHSDEYLRDQIAEGLADLSRGESHTWDVEAAKRRLADRLSQGGR
ncbi:MAG: hypothetical protein ACRCT8_14740 [Lacipirellulaceae bacterium]